MQVTPTFRRAFASLHDPTPRSHTAVNRIRARNWKRLVTRGRILLAVEKYRNGEASLGKAAEVAGLPVGQMMDLLRQFGVRSTVDREDYRQGLANLAKVW